LLKLGDLVVETEAVYQECAEVIRVVEVANQETGRYDTLEGCCDGDPGVSLFLTLGRGRYASGDEVHFVARPASFETNILSSRRLDVDGEITYKWDFGHGQTSDEDDPRRVYTEDGYHSLDLEVTVGNDTARIIDVRIKIGPRSPPYCIWGLPIGTNALSTSYWIPVTEEGDDQNTFDYILISKTGLSEKPVAELGVHFQQMTTDLNLSSLVAETDLIERKSVIHMDSWPEVIEEAKTLYIPSTGTGAVYICPGATSLDEVTPDAPNAVYVNVGQTVDGMTVSTTYYGGEEYYVVEGVSGSGGGEAEPVEQPDLAISTDDIDFSIERPTCGAQVTITAAIRNLGSADAHNAVAAFYDGHPSSATLIGYKTMEIPAGAVYSASVLWDAEAPGSHDIYVVVQVDGLPSDADPANNLASRSITVRDSAIPVGALSGWGTASLLGLLACAAIWMLRRGADPPHDTCSRKVYGNDLVD